MCSAHFVKRTRVAEHQKQGLRCRISPTCTLSQNGYGDSWRLERTAIAVKVRGSMIVARGKSFLPQRAMQQRHLWRFEPTRAEPIGLAGRRLNHSAKVSWKHQNQCPSLLSLLLCCGPSPGDVVPCSHNTTQQTPPNTQPPNPTPDRTTAQPLHTTPNRSTLRPTNRPGRPAAQPLNHTAQPHLPPYRDRLPPYHPTTPPLHTHPAALPPCRATTPHTQPPVQPPDHTTAQPLHTPNRPRNNRPTAPGRPTAQPLHTPNRPTQHLPPYHRPHYRPTTLPPYRPTTPHTPCRPAAHAQPLYTPNRPFNRPTAPPPNPPNTYRPTALPPYCPTQPPTPPLPSLFPPPTRGPSLRCFRTVVNCADNSMCLPSSGRVASRYQQEKQGGNITTPFQKPHIKKKKTSFHFSRDRLSRRTDFYVKLAGVVCPRERDGRRTLGRFLHVSELFTRTSGTCFRRGALPMASGQMGGVRRKENMMSGWNEVARKLWMVKQKKSLR